MSKAFTSRISPQEDWATVPADLRRLAATLAWRKHGPEAVVPVMALIEPPAALVPAFAPASGTRCSPATDGRTTGYRPLFVKFE